ncbi:MAG: hypothetical protein CMO74_02095 [Verrucomicrobiales bacterium]|nr:hypothetical protein [Verrucomicrobiales bacterium]|tara:strand:+ start:194 stop:1411 length:1218 start_codon:yes stop_codon:yes gene_type:complete
MGAEIPMVCAALTKLTQSDVHTGAYGMVFAIALVIESPIIMLLTASTALSRDWSSYQKLHRLMTVSSIALTFLHILIAFTPLYDWLAVQVIKAPADIIEPGRIGLQIMTPWTWAIAHRRFHQGVLIRFGKASAVGWGTGIRLIADAIVLVAGVLVEKYAGIVVAATAIAIGVIIEALYIRWKTHAVLQGPLRDAQGPALTMCEVILFYLPIAFAPTIGLLGQPILTGGLSRLPDPMLTLAIWPTINSLIFMLRSAGIAYTEVVVALLDKPNAHRQLFNFTAILSLVLSLPLLALITTPLIDLWFTQIIGLRVELAQIGKASLWFALLHPAITTWACYFEGRLIHAKRSNPVTEAVLFYTLSLFIFISIITAQQSMPGLNAAVLAMTIGGILQMSWLWIRCRALGA